MKEDLYDDLFDEKEEKTDFQALFFKYVIHWPWFIASILTVSYTHLTLPTT